MVTNAGRWPALHAVSKLIKDIDRCRRMLAICLTSGCIPAKCNVVAGYPSTSKHATQSCAKTKTKTLSTTEQEPHIWMIFTFVWPNTWKA